VSYSVRTVSKREVLAKFAGKDESFGNALEQYLNSLKAEVVGFAMEDGNVTVVLQNPKAPSK
jgi:hypothetical protein